MGSFDLRTISIAAVILLLIGAGAGYMVGNSPVSNLIEEKYQLEAKYDSLYLAFQSLETALNSTQELLVEEQRDNELLLERYMEMLAIDQENQVLNQQVIDLESEITSLQNAYQNIEDKYEEYQISYKAMWDKFDALIQDYNNLTSVDPVGEMTVIEIPGIVNGDFEAGFEGWVKQGKGSLLAGVRYLHQYQSGTFLTQTVTLESKNQGLSFWVKPAPVGADISLEVIIGNYVLYDETYEGQNSDFEWTKVVIPFKALFEMKEFYRLDIEGKYEIRFNIPAGYDNGSHIMLDNVSLVEINYQPGEPEPS